MFRKNKKSETDKPARKKEPLLSIITRDVNILGNIVSDGSLDIDGTVDGNIRAHMLTVRPHGIINGEVIVDALFVYGKIRGLIRARHVHFYDSCHIEGIVMHESLTIEDGAFIDGKCKRTDKLSDTSIPQDCDSLMTDEKSPGDLKILDNIRLIR
jgi:cytoskeletal protein CcmA (bactofilin family)